MKRAIQFYGLLAVLMLIIVAAVGCATTDSENASARPWNAPTGWEFGLPPSMLEGR